jgi:hypothetical protein
VSDPSVKWLMSSSDPSIRYFTLVDLLDAPPDSATARRLKAQIPRSPKVRALLAGQRRDGGFGVHPYAKWNGAHWRLVSLVELGIPSTHRRARAATEDVLRWLAADAHRKRVVQINGRWRRCASQEGNALAVCSRLGMAGDPRVRQLAADLLVWQWPDGGWNCDRGPQADHSSLHESLIPLWGLIEYQRTSGDRRVDAAIERAAEFLLCHRLFRSDHTGTPIDKTFLMLRYPPYWHYGILQALRVVALLGRLADPRAQDALDVLERQRLPDGTWAAQGYWWYAPGARRAREVVDWGRRGPNEMITVHALRVLKAAGRLQGGTRDLGPGTRRQVTLGR